MGGWTLERVQSLIDARIEERTDLVFKRDLCDPRVCEDVAKTVTAMANSGGGALVYGIEQDAQGRAIAPANPLVLLPGAEETIALAVRTMIDESPDIEISHLLVRQGTWDRGYIVVEVPPSDRTPHFCGGIAWGREHQLVRKLKRREIATLFARSDGFLDETGLSHQLRAPARIMAEIHRAGTGRVLLFKNVGDQPAYHVRWSHLEGGGPKIVATEDPFPLEQMLPLVTYPIHGVFPPASLPAKVEVTWRDEVGAPRKTLVVVT